MNKHFSVRCFLSSRCSLYVLLSWLAAGVPVLAQPDTAPALKQQLAQARTDTARHRLYYELGVLYRKVDKDSALFFLNKSLRVAQHLQDPHRTAQSMYRIGFVYYYDKFDETRALEWCKKCLVVAKKANDDLHIARAYIVMGIIADHQNLTREDLLQRALVHAKKANDWFTLVSCYNVIGDIYRKQKRQKEAETAIYNMMAVCEKNSPTYWLLACLDYGSLLESRGAFSLAQAYYRKAVVVQKQINETQKTAEGIFQLARLEIKLKQYSVAGQYLMDCLAMEQAKAQPDTERVSLIYSLLPATYAGQQKYRQAYEAEQKYTELQLYIKEKAHHQSSELQMTRLQATLDLTQKKTEIALLTAKQQKQQLLLLSAISIALLLAGFLWNLWRNRQRIERQRAQLAQLNTDLTDVNATKDRLFAILSHDLRGPIANLSGYLMLHNWGALHPGEFDQLARSLSERLNYVQTMLDNVLNWALSQMNGMQPRIDPVAPAPVLADELALLQPVAQAKGVILTSYVPANASLLADKNHLAIILRNLLQNALKFTPTGGSVRIEYSQTQTHATIEVADAGIGMSKALLANMFNMGRQAPRSGTALEPGTGVGLVLVNDLITANGGQIEVASEEGKGTTFRVSFPVSRNTPFTPSSETGTSALETIV